MAVNCKALGDWPQNRLSIRVCTKATMYLVKSHGPEKLNTEVPNATA
jgi:hypothetical protein